MGKGRAISYRADIDGLRAVAVLSVLLFHIDFTWVPGGYTGVDVFFVISGFLITRIIGQDIEDGRFSLRWFYVRRIRRILPVFYTVVLTTIAVGAVLLLPEDLHSLLSSVRHAVFFSANIYFSRDKGYFDISADEKPLLHIWSLSVEEQYYFVWPLLLLIFYTIGHLIFRQARRLGQPAAVILTSAFALVGYVYAQHLLTKSPAATDLYFLIQTRFSELMTGSMVALLPLCDKTWVRRVLSYAGVGLLLAGLVMLSKDSIFPGYNALLPCLGAAMLIYAGQGGESGRTWIQRALSLRAMTIVGLGSYSIYLWHWPVLAYMRYVYGSYRLPTPWIIQAVVLTFLLAFLSYRYVERGTKTATIGFGRAFFGVFLAPALLMVAITYGLESARPPLKLDSELTSYGRDLCHGSLDKSCERGDPEKGATILMVGDSHAAALNSFIDVVGRHEGWAADVVTGSGCSPVFGFDHNILPNYARKPCSDLKDYFEQRYRDYEAVFLASLWARQLGMRDDQFDRDYIAKLEVTLRAISHVVPVYVFSDTPRLTISPSRALHLSNLGLRIDREPTEEHVRANKIVKAMVQDIPNVYWVDLSPALEGFDHMSAYKGKPTYFDDHHLNIYGSEALGELFIQSGAAIIRQR